MLEFSTVLSTPSRYLTFTPNADIFISAVYYLSCAFSALILLVGWQEGHPACKKLSGGVLAWLCLEWGADLHVAQLMPLPLTVCCFSEIQTCFSFLIPAHLGSPGKRAVKRVCVCVLLTSRVQLFSVFDAVFDTVFAVGLTGQYVLWASAMTVACWHRRPKTWSSTSRMWRRVSDVNTSLMFL